MGVRHAGRFKSPPPESRQHAGIFGWLSDLDVLAFGVEEDHGDVGCLSLGNESTDRGRLAAARRSQDRQVSREDGFLVRGDPDRHVRVTHQHPEANVSVGMERGELLRCAEHMHRTVRKRAKSRRDQATVEFLSQQLDLRRGRGSAA